MSKTPGETRAYAKGYGRATSRYWTHVTRVLDIARGYRGRLKDFDTARRCDTCRRWTRGCDTCVWGHCSHNFERPLEPSMWPDPDHADIITTEDFGCVNWLPRGEA